MWLCIAGLGGSSVMAQLALLREMLGVFFGNEMVLGIILGNWLLLTGLGAWLGRSVGRLRRPQRALVILQMLAGLLPLAQTVMVRSLRPVFFLRGEAVGVTETVLSSALVLLPFCLVSGFLLTLACVLLARNCAEADAVGRVYVADSLGGLVGGVLFSLVLVRYFDHFNLLCWPAFLNLGLAGCAAWVFGERTCLAVATVFTLGLALLLYRVPVDGPTMAWQYPAQRVLLAANSPYGKLVVAESAGQMTFYENGLALMSSHNLEQVEETVHYAMAQRPEARHVLLVAGGLSGTAREILKYPVSEVVYVELDPLILDAGRRFLPANLAEARIRVVNTDGRRFIQQTNGRFDVVIVDVPDPSTSQLNRFYTVEFFRAVRSVLTPDGVLAVSLGHYENYVSPELARLLSCGYRTIQSVFSRVLALPGGRVCFLASAGELHPDIAARLEQRQIPTRFVNAHYLQAALSPDRLADMQRAVSQPASINRDFGPVLYFYHLAHWRRQFELRFGVLEVGLVALLAIYLARLRSAALAVFAGGFAASALEFVLLLGFQILYGSMYLQVGFMVTLFMAGLALGSMMALRWRPARPRHRLAGLSFILAGSAALAPWMLQGLGRFGGGAVPAMAGQTVIAAMTLLLATLVGLQFPLAAVVESRGAALTASRLYTADLVGACLGALLGSTLLIPLLGVTATCLLTAGLNLVGGLAVKTGVRPATR